MKKFAAMFLAVAFLLLPAACKKNQSNLTTIKLNEVTHSIFYAPLYLAMNLNYFEEEGLKIELTTGQGADKVMTSVLSGGAHIGFCGPETVVYTYNEGSNNYPVIFGQLTKRDGSFLFSRNDEPNFKWSDLEGKEILAGRKGGMPAMTLEYVLNNNNLYDGVNVTLNYAVPFANMGPAFYGGAGDYTTLFEPVASTMRSANQGYIVKSIGLESGEVPYTVFMAKKSYISANEKTIKAFLRAVYKAIYFLENNTDEIVAEKLMSQYRTSTYNEVLFSVKSYRESDAWASNMSMSEDAFTRLQDIMENAGQLDKRAPHNLLVENSYAEEIYKSVFK